MYWTNHTFRPLHFVFHFGWRVGSFVMQFSFRQPPMKNCEIETNCIVSMVVISFIHIEFIIYSFLLNKFATFSGVFSTFVWIYLNRSFTIFTVLFDWFTGWRWTIMHVRTQQEWGGSWWRTNTELTNNNTTDMNGTRTHTYTQSQQQRQRQRQQCNANFVCVFFFFFCTKILLDSMGFSFCRRQFNHILCDVLGLFTWIVSFSCMCVRVCFFHWCSNYRRWQWRRRRRRRRRCRLLRRRMKWVAPTRKYYRNKIKNNDGDEIK